MWKLLLSELGMSQCPYHDPFKKKRAEGPVLETEFDNHPVAMILGLKDVRKAARNHETFSSNAPFRVPIPSEESLRSVRQFPIESDPPEHTEYREIVEPIFNRPNQPDYQKRITKIIEALVIPCMETDSFDAINDFALPLQSRALALLLNVPEEESELWIKWGVHVLREGDGSSKGREMEDYCKHAFLKSSEWGDDNLFSILNHASFQGRFLTDDEKLGFANLAFAGGRDTVINTLCVVLAHFADNNHDFVRLSEEPELINCAGEEFIRFATPLTHIGRKCPIDSDVHGVEVKANQLISLSWASANFDESVFLNPEIIKIDRKPNPHIAFGNGPHNCLGAPHARLLIRKFISVLIQKVSKVSLLSCEPKTEKTKDYQRVNGYEHLKLCFFKK